MPRPQTTPNARVQLLSGRRHIAPDRSSPAKQLLAWATKSPMLEPQLAPASRFLTRRPQQANAANRRAEVLVQQAGIRSLAQVYGSNSVKANVLVSTDNTHNGGGLRETLGPSFFIRCLCCERKRHFSTTERGLRMERLDTTHEVVKLSTLIDDKSQTPIGQLQVNAERLPFRIRVAHGESDLQKAVGLRRAAYGRHVPEFGMTMTAEDSDRSTGTTILLAESKFDGAPLGTMRVETNDHAPLAVEHSVTLPGWCGSGRLAEATRLSVVNGGGGRMVKIALFKALFLLCERKGVNWLIVTARSPIDREYEAIQFKEVFEDRQYIPMPHVGGLPHRVMALEVGVGRQRWKEARHPLYRFVFETHHPDIDLSDVKCSTLQPDTVRFDEHTIGGQSGEIRSKDRRRDLQYY